MERDWIYLQNPFLNTTENNFSKFNSIINYSHSRFNAPSENPFFATMATILNPAASAWNSTYAAWIESEGEHKSTTSTVKQLFDDLSSELIGSWNRRISVVYAPGTAAYVRLLPRGSAPYQSSTQANRLLAVQALSLALAGDAALAAVKTEVDNFYADITAAKNEQTDDLSQTDLLSDALEITRVLGAKALQKTLGSMIAEFVETPEIIGNYYDLENLRSKEQVSFTHGVAKSANIVVVKRKLTESMQIRVVNDGSVDLKFYYAAEKNDAIGSAFMLVEAGEDKIADAATLGNLTTGHFIKALNPSDLAAGHFTLTIIK